MDDTANIVWWTILGIAFALLGSAAFITKHRDVGRNNPPWRYRDLKRYPSPLVKRNIVGIAVALIGIVLLCGTRGPRAFLGLVILSVIGLTGMAAAIKDGRIGRKFVRRVESPIAFWTTIAAIAMALLGIVVQGIRH